ncbi:S8 family serine peptidase [Mycolicibacterium mageritense]|uniref:S8 family serine peptidase n=1 Tax=Mycolicibacterium mageritense TaxID=53462 RepID=UPI001E643A40|nr:S8 family serine peptidase [Mycolicibacterium mageritense]GJJ24133.1 hypothetical protein MTY414_78070 [Mycolicibacterium mageritense]
MAHDGRGPALCRALAAAGLVMSVVAVSGGTPAWAIDPPVVPPGPPPDDPEPGPDQPMKRVSECVQTTVAPGSDFRELPAPLQMLDMPAAWKESTGAGVVVGIIDTGVAPQPRLPHLVAGGDYVMGRYGDGLEDCDAHGTLIASLIGAAPSGAPLPVRPTNAAAPPPLQGAPEPIPVPPPPPPPTVTVTATVTSAPPPPPPPPPGDGPPPEGAPPPPEGVPPVAPAWGQAAEIPMPATPPPGGGPDGLIGIAPDATLISIRQTAQTFGYAEPQFGANTQDVRRVGDIHGMARAVVRMANLGAKVINISVVACIPVAKPADLSELGAALRYAAVDKDAVIVTAAGNAGTDQCKGQNPDPEPGSVDDPLGWNTVGMIAAPAIFDQFVLTVAATDSSGTPLTDQAASLHGPWVGLAAPGADIVGLGTNGHITNASVGEDGKLKPIVGSSFSAAYTSGVAALVRAKFPQLSAHQVIRRLQATATPPAGGRDTVVGYGVIDPVAALTWDVPPGDWLAPGVDVPLHRKPAPPPADPRPGWGAGTVIGVAVCAIGAAAWMVTVARRRRAGDSPRAWEDRWL